MTQIELDAAARAFVASASDNRIGDDFPGRPDLAGTAMYEPPIFAFADAADPLFAEFKKPEIVHERFLGPTEWLPGARSVATFFLPFTRAVKDSNALSMDWPSPEWMYARVDGQRFIARLTAHLASLVEAEGFKCVVPATDPRFWTGHNPPPVDGVRPPAVYASNWSERHAGFAAGLGTFCLSKGMITAKGVAGRFSSIVTTCPFPATPRPYTDIYEYCTFCGVCARHCPGKAISVETGKSHPPCAAFVQTTAERHAPRFGCGKCQVKTPCESRIPAKRR